MRDYFTPEGRHSIHKVREMFLDRALWKKKKPSAATINEFIQKFWTQDLYDSILMIPWVTERLIGHIKHNGRLPTRFELYSDVIVGITRKNRTITQDLYKIGLHFELIQQNQLPIPEFTKALRKLKLQRVTLQWLLDRKLVETVSEEVDGTVVKNIKWFHHSFTEFLTADGIFRSGEPIAGKLTSLAVIHLDEDNTNNIKPSWVGVIGFLLGSPRGLETLEWVITMIEKNPLNLFETIGNAIVLYAPGRVSDDLKDRVFRAIYGTIQDRGIWIRSIPSFGLWRFYTENQLAIIDKDCKATGDEVATYVHQGNAVAYFTELIRNKKVSESVKKTWKPRLVQFAQDKNMNGVLQRYTLDALELYRDARLVKILKPYYDLPERQNDELLSQAFVQFCTNVQKKNKESVEVLINAAKQKMDVYGRHGLQELSKKNDIILFLRALLDDPVFLDRFIDSESIFSGDSDDEGDRKLIGKILLLAQKDRRIQKLLYAIIVAALKNPDLFNLHQSYLIRTFFARLPDTGAVVTELLRLAQEEKEQDRNRFAYKLFDLLPIALTSKNWKRLLALIEKSDMYPRQRVDDVIYRLRWLGDEHAKQLFVVIAGQRKLPIESAESITELEVAKNRQILKDFQWKLQPEPGQYMTDVFEYYLQNAKVLDPLKPKDKKRLLYLAYSDGIKRLDPNEFSLKITGFPEQRNQFTWSRQASFFGDMVRVVEKLAPRKLLEPDVQQHLIDFIPFAYTSDEQTIHKHVTRVIKSQLTKLNKHISETRDHRRYHLPDSYVSFIDHLSKRNDVHFCLPVLKSLIGADYIDEWVSVKALKVYGSIEGKTDKYRKMLDEIFRTYVKSNRLLTEEANRQLIEIFSDGAAIKWRIAQIKARIKPFIPLRSGIAHAVGPDEEEFDSMHFAKPLTYVVSRLALEDLVNLYNEVNKYSESDERYESYRNYVWRILIQLLEGVMLQGKYDMFFDFSQVILRKIEYTSWMQEEIREIRRKLVDVAGRLQKI